MLKKLLLPEFQQIHFRDFDPNFWNCSSTPNWKSVVNFINILRTNFSYERCFGSFSLVTCKKEQLPKRHLYKKFVRKLLMKLTPVLLENPPNRSMPFAAFLVYTLSLSFSQLAVVAVVVETIASVVAVAVLATSLLVWP